MSRCSDGEQDANNAGMIGLSDPHINIAKSEQSIQPFPDVLRPAFLLL